MGREKQDFRDNLERIAAHFGQELIPLRKAAAFCGVDPRVLMMDKNSPVKKICGRYYVTAVGLARWLSQGEIKSPQNHNGCVGFTMVIRRK